MDQIRCRRVGAAAIVCALAIRSFAWGWPEKLINALLMPEIFPYIVSLETGHIVRFSPYYQEILPDFVESPPAAAEAGAIPAFAQETPIPLYDPGQLQPDLAALLAAPLTWNLPGEAPTVLILHTHATESYTKGDLDYSESAAWRTAQPEYNMLRVGQEVAQILTQAGIPTIHDQTLHDYPSYNGSYTRARRTLRQQLAGNPQIQLVLDLHRDAVEGPQGQLGTKATVDGRPSAQLMLVLGSNQDHYEENLSLALKLHQQLESQAPGIMRKMQLRPARFNQDLSPGALLVEVGAAGNTLEEALLAAQQLAKAIIALSHGTAP